MSTQTFKIVRGPSKFDLMIALFHVCGNGRHPLAFKVNGRKLEVLVTINGVSREDGSGESWCFQGYSQPNKHVKGWFRTDTRRGQIEIEE